MKKSIGVAALLGAMCLALMPIAAAHAANWVYVGKATDNVVYYYDADTLQRSGDEVTVWEKADHSRDATAKFRSKIGLYRYSCSKRTYVLISLTRYFPNGKNESSRFSPANQSEELILPDSVSEAMLEAVCR
jgi:hypothetical protein